jgi:hypothetical protein
MPGYRLYFFDPEGRIRQALELECDDESHAVRTAESRRDAYAMELWRRADRLRSWPAQRDG